MCFKDDSFPFCLRAKNGPAELSTDNISTGSINQVAFYHDHPSNKASCLLHAMVTWSMSVETSVQY